MWKKVFLFFIAGLFLNCCNVTGLDLNKQRHNSNTDFLLHEGSNVPSAPKRDYVANNPKQQTLSNSAQQNNNRKDYDNQFPALGQTYKTTQSLMSYSTAASGKRDYVAPQPQQTTSKPKVIQNDGKLDFDTYFPALGQTSLPPNKPQNNGKRDYVAPTPKPQSNSPTQVTGKVKDLVSFFDKQGTPAKSLIQPTKPLSFSDIVAGPNKQGSSSTSTQSVTTPTIATKGSTNKFSTQTTKGQTVLPSTLNNKNKNEGNAVTDLELQTISEELLRKDVNNAAKYLTVNYQEKTSASSNDDKAPLPLITITPAVWNIPTIQKFVPLLDNYERDTMVNEYVTPQERNEENAFMDAIMTTSVIRHLMLFLKDKGYVTPDPRQQRDFLKQLWFSLYARSRGKVGSSGFEHIFVSELKNGEVSGLHNWIYFSKEETANRANYLGYLKYATFNDKGAVLKLHFNQQGVNKPVDTMFIGTSPELEIALYTLCFITRADNDCKLKLGNKDVNIVTHTFRYRSKNLIGSAYPQI